MFYQAVILGAGPGGYVAAIRASQMGLKVAIIEKNKVGGTCLNEGCIPTKALIQNVEIIESIKKGKRRGIRTEGVSLDYSKAIRVKDRSVKQLVTGVETLLRENGVDVYYGKGIVHKNKTITVKSETGSTEIEYGKLIIATGSSPASPPIKGIDAEGVVSSGEFLSMTEVPEKMVIIGGGVVGCELAGIMAAYGSQVTIIEMLPRLVANLDTDISSYMRYYMEKRNINVKLSAHVLEICRNADSLQVKYRDGNESKADDCNLVLVSAGRKANLEGLEELELDVESGLIKVDCKMQTSVEDVYAIGDVATRKQLAHVASAMGIVAAANVAGEDKMMNYDIVPSCIYTNPEIGSVGMSEKEATEKGYELLIGRFPLVACGKAVAVDDTVGEFKIIADKKTRKILGAHLAGKNATEIVAEAAAYMKMGATIDDVSDTIHAHPTISEAFAEAANAAAGRCIHIFNK